MNDDTVDSLLKKLSVDDLQKSTGDESFVPTEVTLPLRIVRQMCSKKVVMYLVDCRFKIESDHYLFYCLAENDVLPPGLVPGTVVKVTAKTSRGTASLSASERRMQLNPAISTGAIAPPQDRPFAPMLFPQEIHEITNSKLGAINRETVLTFCHPDTKKALRKVPTFLAKRTLHISELLHIYKEAKQSPIEALAFAGLSLDTSIRDIMYKWGLAVRPASLRLVRKWELQVHPAGDPNADLSEEWVWKHAPFTFLLPQVDSDTRNVMLHTRSTVLRATGELEQNFRELPNGKMISERDYALGLFIAKFLTRVDLKLYALTPSNCEGVLRKVVEQIPGAPVFVAPTLRCAADLGKVGIPTVDPINAYNSRRKATHLVLFFADMLGEYSLANLLWKFKPKKVTMIGHPYRGGSPFAYDRGAPFRDLWKSTENVATIDVPLAPRGILSAAASIALTFGKLPAQHPWVMGKDPDDNPQLVATGTFASAIKLLDAPRNLHRQTGKWLVFGDLGDVREVYKWGTMEGMDKEGSLPSRRALFWFDGKARRRTLATPGLVVHLKPALGSVDHRTCCGTYDPNVARIAVHPDVTTIDVCPAIFLRRIVNNPPLKAASLVMGPYSSPHDLKAACELVTEKLFVSQDLSEMWERIHNRRRPQPHTRLIDAIQAQENVGKPSPFYKATIPEMGQRAYCVIGVTHGKGRYPTRDLRVSSFVADPTVEPPPASWEVAAHQALHASAPVFLQDFDESLATRITVESLDNHVRARLTALESICAWEEQEQGLDHTEYPANDQSHIIDELSGHKNPLSSREREILAVALLCIAVKGTPREDWFVEAETALMKFRCTPGAPRTCRFLQVDGEPHTIHKDIIRRKLETLNKLAQPDAGATGPLLQYMLLLQEYLSIPRGDSN